YQQDIPTGVNAAGMLIAQFLVPGALFLFVGGRDSRLLVGMAIAVILLLVGTQLYLGYRADAVWPLIGLVCVYDRSVKTLSRTPLVGGSFLVLFVVFPAIRVIRDYAGSQSRGIQSLQDAYASIDNPFSFIFREIGGSLATVAYAIKFVP